MIISKIDQIMKEKKVTSRDIVQRTHLSMDTLARARNENIRKCRLYTLELIAEFLGVNTKDLYDEIPDIDIPPPKE